MNAESNKIFLFLPAVVFLLTMLLCPVFGRTQNIQAEWSFLREYKFYQMPELPLLTNKDSLVLLDDVQAPAWKIDWDTARKFLYQGDLEDAEEYYRRLLRAKNVLEARWELANILASTDRVKEALQLVEILFEEDPSRKDFLFGQAVLQLRGGDLVRAAQSYALLAEAEPGNSKAISGCAFCFLSLNQPDKAFPYIASLAAEYPENFPLQQLYVQQGYALNYPERAYKKVGQLIRNSNANKETFALSAKVADSLGHTKEAASYWQRVLEFDSEDIYAHQKLAEYFEKNGLVDKAVDHFLFINKKRPADEMVIRKIGQCYVGMMEFDKALPFFEEYIAKNPRDKEAVRTVVNIQAALGDKEETLAALEHYFAIESAPDKVNLEKAAQLYDEHGLAQEAIDIYRRLLKLSPDDPSILTALADNLLALGRDEDALTVWRKLARIAPKVVEVYRPMATLLEKLGREEELLNVLEAIVELDPDDISVQLQLAERYLHANAMSKCRTIFERLSNFSLSARRPSLPVKFYELRGSFRARTLDYVGAYADFQTVLGLLPGNVEIRISALNAAGRLGDLREVQKHYSLLDEHAGALSTEQILVCAEAFLHAGGVSEARHFFEKVILDIRGAVTPMEKLDSALTGRAYVGMAQSYLDEKLFYEAESVLRQGLAETQAYDLFLPPLFDMNLKKNQLSAADQWLSEIESCNSFSFWQKKFAKTRMLRAQGEMRAAKRYLYDLLGKLLTKYSTKLEGSARAEMLERMKTILPELWQLGTQSSVSDVCEKILQLSPDALEPLVVLQQFGPLDAVKQKLFDLLRMKPGRLIEAAAIYERYGRYDQMAEAAGKAVMLLPGTFKASLLQARASRLSGNSVQAEEMYRDLVEKFPEQAFVQVELATLLFDRGQYADVLELIGHFTDKELTGNVLLLQARALWAHDKESESLEHYKKAFRGAALSEDIAEISKQYKVILPKIIHEQSVLEKIFQVNMNAGNEALDDYVMSPSYLIMSIKTQGTEFSRDIAGLYAKYRWKQQFARELATRDAVRKEEYFYAQKLYENIVRQYPDDVSLLYDLAGVYGRLGKLGTEAAIYEKLIGEGTHLAGLKESLAINRLKQRPKMVITVAHSQEEGHDDYKDIEKDWQKLCYWYSPRTQHETTVELSHINYQAQSWDDVVRAHRVELGYKAPLFSGLTIGVTGGFENHSQGDSGTFLFGIEGEGKIGDAFVGSFSLHKDVVEDTTASLRRGLVRHELLAGVSYEPFYWLALGGDYTMIDYSDTNLTTGYDFWSSYLLHSHPTFLKLFYKYEFKESTEGNNPLGAMLADHFTADDHPYWAPKNYWTNQFGISFRHELGHDSIIRDAPKYYEAQYYFGHDSNGNGFQGATGGFFVEITPRLLLSAKGELISSPAYRKKQYAVTASYKW